MKRAFFVAAMLVTLTGQASETGLAAVPNQNTAQGMAGEIAWQIRLACPIPVQITCIRGETGLGRAAAAGGSTLHVAGWPALDCASQPWKKRADFRDDGLRLEAHCAAMMRCELTSICDAAADHYPFISSP